MATDDSLPNDEIRARDLRRELVRQLQQDGAILTDAVADAFFAVPRHRFLPDTPLDQVYRDVVIPTKFTGHEAISSSSQPTMMAIMLEQGDFRPNQRVLEIGAGTGYNAALIAHIVGESGQVTTIDIDDDLVAAARDHLRAAGYERVRVLLGDGWHGDPSAEQAAPYDRIMVTARALDISRAWFDQLAYHGRLIVPLDIWAGVQYSVAFERLRDSAYGDCLVSRSSSACGFIPLRGLGVSENSIIPGEMITRDTDMLSISRAAFPQDDDLITPYESIRLMLVNDWVDRESSVSASAYALYGAGFYLWMALRARPPFAPRDDLRPVLVSGKSEMRRSLGDLFGRSRRESARSSEGSETVQTFGIASNNGLALLLRGGERGNRMRLIVRRFGHDETPAHYLIHLLQAWAKAGQPTADHMQVAAIQSDVPLPEHPTVIRKPAFSYIVRWVNAIM